MWHEARKQEKKVRGMIVDYKRRAERRREFYEKIRRDPAQFLQIHGSSAKIHMDSTISAAADSCLMPWRGDEKNMIDRFDVRAHLDTIEEIDAGTTSTGNRNGTGKDASSERQINYERWRNLIQNEFLGISESKALHQIWLEERFGMNQPSMTDSPAQQNANLKKKLAEKKAKIGYNYDKPEESKNMVKPANESSSSEEESESDEDYDTTVNIETLNNEQMARLNLIGVRYGLSADDFSSFAEEDLAEAERIRLAKELENEKSMFSGRKSRRERRALKERRMLILRANNAEENIKPVTAQAPTTDKSKASSSESSESDVDEAKIEFITSFGGSSEEETGQEKPKKDGGKNKSSSKKKDNKNNKALSAKKFAPVEFGPSLPPEIQQKIATKSNISPSSPFRDFSPPPRRSPSVRRDRSRPRSHTRSSSRSRLRIRNHSRSRSRTPKWSKSRVRSRSRDRSRSRSRARSPSRSRSHSSKRSSYRRRSRDRRKRRHRSRSKTRSRSRSRSRNRSHSRSRLRYDYRSCRSDRKRGSFSDSRARSKTRSSSSSSSSRSRSRSRSDTRSFSRSPGQRRHKKRARSRSRSRSKSRSRDRHSKRRNKRRKNRSRSRDGSKSKNRSRLRSRSRSRREPSHERIRTSRLEHDKKSSAPRKSSSDKKEEVSSRVQRSPEFRKRSHSRSTSPQKNIPSLNLPEPSTVEKVNTVKQEKSPSPPSMDISPIDEPEYDPEPDLAPENIPIPEPLPQVEEKKYFPLSVSSFHEEAQDPNLAGGSSSLILPNPPLKRYYRHDLADESSSDPELEEAKPVPPPPREKLSPRAANSVANAFKAGSSCVKAMTDKLKKKTQALIERQYKLDKAAERERQKMGKHQKNPDEKDYRRSSHRGRKYRHRRTRSRSTSRSRRRYTSHSRSRSKSRSSSSSRTRSKSRSSSRSSSYTSKSYSSSSSSSTSSSSD